MKRDAKGSKYTCKWNYENVVNYGFVAYSYLDGKEIKRFTAEEYIQYLAMERLDILSCTNPINPYL